MRADALDADRFDRMRRIGWMDMERISRSRCLVVGAGALGNEAVKCMVLAGFRNIDVVDTDHVVNSNLSRCVLFREGDNGLPKSEVLAERAAELCPQANVRAITAKVQELDRWDYDLALGCLDNFSARMHVNSHTAYFGIPYVDGATDGMTGKMQVVLPGGPCLQCASNSSHEKIADRRFSCTGNSHVFIPHTAAEITTTSIIAAMQVREAEKLASGRSDLCASGITYYNGEAGTMGKVALDIDPGCPNHQENKR
ncbi:MAG: ThiF family adenylyltransferase [Methanomassiliicoccaceae archaeon]|nr:ThiF family adenylyltransferase [Methanomassiliicoccaceae archaeon]